MSDKDLEKLEEFKGEVSGSIKGIRAGTYMAEHEESKLEDKKKKQKEVADLILKQLMDELDEIVSDLGGLVKQRQENTTKLKQATNIMKNWDMQEAQLFLMDQGVNVEGMDENALVNAMRNQIKTLTQNDKPLAQQIADKAQDAQNKIQGQNIDPGFEKEFSNIMQQAEKMGIDADKAIVEAKKIASLSNKAIIKGDTKFTANEKRNALSNTTSPENDLFAEVAKNNAITTSFAKSVGEPFAESAGTITDPFNEVANQQGIEPKRDTSLDAQPQEPWVKVEAPKFQE